MDLQSRVGKLESHVADLERRLDAALTKIEQAIAQNTSATLEAIDEASRDWRHNR